MGGAAAVTPPTNPRGGWGCRISLVIFDLDKKMSATSESESEWTASLDESPTAFLARVKAACPDIISILSLTQARLLSQSPTEPYLPDSVNEHYVRDKGICFSLRMLHDDTRKKLSESLLKPLKKDQVLDVETVDKKAKIFEMVANLA